MYSQLQNLKTVRDKAKKVSSLQMDVFHILPLVRVLFTAAIRRQTMNPVKTGPTYFQILPRATSRSHSDHTYLSVPQTRQASVAFRIFAWPVPLAHNMFLPVLSTVTFIIQMIAA